MIVKAGSRAEIRFEQLKWLNIENASEEDIKYLGRKFKFHQLDLEDCLSVNQRPKIDEYPNYLFITLHCPQVNARTKRIQSMEIHFFVLEDNFITIHDRHPGINKIFNACKKNAKTKEEYMKAGSGYMLYSIVDELFESSLPILDDLSRDLTAIEQDVFEGDFHRDKLQEILAFKKDIINFRRIIIPQRAVVAQLESKNSKFSKDNLEIYFDDVVDKIEKIWSMLENLKELADSVRETNESMISHDTNNIMKILTVFSVMMLPLTVITGFYGMNVKGLPLAEADAASIGVAILLLLIVTLMLLVFKFKKWI
jgi:magnesium transporter